MYSEPAMKACPTVISLQDCESILGHLRHQNVTLASLIRSILHHSVGFRSENSRSGPDILDFVNSLPNVLSDLASTECTTAATEDWIFRTSGLAYAEEIKSLSKRDSGLHFNAANATEESLQDVTVQRLSGKMKKLAPRLWALFDNLMSADPDVAYQRDRKRKQRAARAGNQGPRQQTERRGVDIEACNVPVDDGGDEWEEMVEGLEKDMPEDLEEQLEDRRLRIIEMVRICDIYT